MTSEEFRNNPMFLRNQFAGDGVFNIPLLKKDEISLEKVELVGYDKLSNDETDKIVHFFLDDYKFEVLWKDPEPRITRLKQYKAVLSPNFSVYTEMPLSLKIYNTFRSRWCGAYFQSMGIKVIPTVAWGAPDTFWFCFDGIPKGSTVAVSTVGVRTEKDLFLQGYNELLRRIKPSTVICYGEPFEEMQGKIITVDYAETNGYLKHYSIVYDENSSFSDDNIPLYTKTIKTKIEFDKGMGSASGIDGKLSILKKKLKDLPENVRQAYKNYKKNGWKGNYSGQSNGTRSGRMWANRKNQLPSNNSKGTITYQEFDVNNRVAGQRRDAARFVRGSDGSVYYTSDHYSTFVKIIE